MKSVYRVLALLIAAGVAFQAAAIAYGVFALGKWVEAGGTLDKASLESESSQVGGDTGFMLHGMVGIMAMPALALLLLIISFFAKIPGGTRWALIVFGVTIVQVALGMFARDVAGLGWLHGITALILFGVAVSAAMRVRTNAVVDERTPAHAV